MNEIELILQEKPEKFANLLKTHTIAFLERCTNEFVWKIWQEYGDTAIPFEEFKRNHLGNRPSKYRYNGLSIFEPVINEAEKIVFSLGGWRGLGTSDLKTLLVFTIIPTSQRIQIFGSCDPDAEDLYHYLLEQIPKHFPDVPPAAATPRPPLINHTQRLQHLQEQLQERLNLLHQYEQQESTEDDPRHLRKIKQNIAREKKAIAGLKEEMAALGPFGNSS